MAIKSLKPITSTFTRWAVACSASAMRSSRLNIGFLLGLAAIASTTLSNILAARVTISI